jgi:hypothetical protein
MINFAFRDIFVNLASIFLLLALLLVPIKENKSESEDANTKAQGELVVIMNYAPVDRDIDVWIQHPGSTVPVGWSNKGDRNCDLLRDDLGDRPSIDTLKGVNMELIQCRRLLVGEYIINVHFYGGGQAGGNGGGLAMNVPVTIEVRSTSGGRSVMMDKHHVVLAEPSDWKTVSRFQINEDGNLTGAAYRDPYPMHLGMGGANTDGSSLPQGDEE